MSGVVGELNSKSGVIDTINHIQFVPTDVEPSAVAGMVYFDDSETHLKSHSGSAWKQISASS